MSNQWLSTTLLLLAVAAVVARLLCQCILTEIAVDMCSITLMML